MLLLPPLNLRESRTLNERMPPYMQNTLAGPYAFAPVLLLASATSLARPNREIGFGSDILLMCTDSSSGFKGITYVQGWESPLEKRNPLSAITHDKSGTSDLTLPYLRLFSSEA